MPHTEHGFKLFLYFCAVLKHSPSKTHALPQTSGTEVANATVSIAAGRAVRHATAAASFNVGRHA